MGLFGKNKEDQTFGTSDESGLDNGMADKSMKARKSALSKGPANFMGGGSAPSKKNNSNGGIYGIEDAIKLMRKLPKVNSDIVVTVVKKTLESADIQVEQIIEDAKQREANIIERNTRLSGEIEQLQAKISGLNKEITQLSSELEETTIVKDLLLSSVDDGSDAEEVSSISGAISDVAGDDAGREVKKLAEHAKA